MVIGRIYETRTGPADLRWFWALYAPSKPGTMRTDNRAATLDEAKAEFEASWKQWKAWAGSVGSPAVPGREERVHMPDKPRTFRGSGSLSRPRRSGAAW